MHEQYNLSFKNEHVFIEINGKHWILDTGSPISFGINSSLELAGHSFAVKEAFMGLNAEKLSEFIGASCEGLIGVDILNQFDHILDSISGSITITSDILQHSGEEIELLEFMKIPILKLQIAGKDHPMFFDTGAQISYFQDRSLRNYPEMGELLDFHPSIGQFRTETYQVPFKIGTIPYVERFGQLPPLVTELLRVANVVGIIGHKILHGRIVGYFPRRHRLVL